MRSRTSSRDGVLDLLLCLGVEPDAALADVELRCEPFCAFRSLIVDLHFDVGRVQHADSALLRLVFDQFALATADLRGDPHRLRVAVDALKIVRVVHADLLEALGCRSRDAFGERNPASTTGPFAFMRRRCLESRRAACADVGMRFFCGSPAG